MEAQKVDVIIPTRRPDEKLVRSVERLLKQTYPVHAIYLINTVTGTFPRELEKLSDKIHIMHIAQEQFDHGGTRRRGAEMSRADILIYMTQDAVPVNENLVLELMKAFENPRVGAAYARQLPDAGCHLAEQFTRRFNYPPEGRVKSEEDLPELGIKTYFCSNVCAAYRKSVYESLGGFEQKIIFNEDMVMAGKIIQSGCRVAYVPEAQVIHSHNYTCIQQLKRNFDMAVSQTEHPEIFEGIKSEKEGIRLVVRTAQYLLEKKKPWLLFPLAAGSGFKYLGYWLGKHYRSLPRWMVMKCTMNPGYWGDFMNGNNKGNGKRMGLMF